jgi:drug/metabolite transporter (DMT)-like permease
VDTIRSRRWVYAALTLSTFFWGSGFAVARFALSTVSPLELLAGASLLAAVFEVLWMVARGGGARLRLPSSLLWPVLVLGLTGQSILNGLTLFGLKLTTATNAALIFGFSPVIIGILGALFLREPLSALKRWGAGVGFAGVALIITQAHLESFELRGVMMGNLVVLGGATFWAAFSVITRSITRRLPPDVFTFYFLVLGTAAPVIWFWAEEKRFPLAGVALPALAAIAWFALTTSVVAINIWSWALEKIEASRVGVFTYLEPVFAALTAMAFLGERFTLPTAAGALLVFAGIYLSTRRVPADKP